MAGPSDRTIVESKLFSQQREHIQPIARLWDEFMFGLDWVLSRNPEAGQQVLTLNVWLIVTEPSSMGLPRMRILYRFDGDQVELLELDWEGSSA